MAPKNKQLSDFDKAAQEFDDLCASQSRVVHQQGKLIGPQKKRLDQSRLARMTPWADKWSHLTGPWSDSALGKILAAGPPGRFTEIMEWLETPYVAHKGLLEFLLERGLNSTTFIPRAHVTLLGYASYSLRHESVALMLKHTSPPASRLVLTSQQLSGSSSQQDGKLLNSTLLHRLASRVKSDDLRSLETFKAIVEHDPDVLLCQTQSGHTADQMAGGAIKSYLHDARQEHQAFLTKAQLTQGLAGISSRSGSSRKI